MKYYTEPSKQILIKSQVEAPNILLIYTDQQRFDTIGALNNPYIHTPNLDRLVKQGVAFTHASTPSPVCMAARWSLHTGQWTTTHQCYSNHHSGESPSFNLPAILREGGYKIGLSGKNHSFLKPEDFDFFDINPKLCNSNDLSKKQEWVKNIFQVKYPRLAEEAVPGGSDCCDERAKTDAGIHFIESCEGKPFFLWLSYLFPHTPYEVSEPYFSMYKDVTLPEPIVEKDGLMLAGKPFRQQFHQYNNDAVLPFTKEQTKIMKQVYYGMISFIDAEVGRILDYLDKSGLANNTMVVFTSDHGDYMGDHSLYTKSPALYDCLVRIPMVFRWPGHIDEGRVDDRFASAVDLFPTFVAAADIKCQEEVQGINLLPFLRDGGKCGEIRTAAYSEYGIPGEPYTEERLKSEGIYGKLYTNAGQKKLPWEGNPVSLSGRIRMIRTHEWKYVEDTGGTCELYNIISDPNELENLWNQPEYEEMRQIMVQKLQEWKCRLPGIEKDHLPVL